MNSLSWSAPNIWVFIVHLEAHSNANAEAMGSNPVKALNFFPAKICNCLNCDYNCDDDISISSAFPQFKSTSCHYRDVVRKGPGNTNPALVTIVLL